MPMVETQKPKMRIPSDIKKGSIVEIKVKIDHLMESGLRKDKDTKKLIPKHTLEKMYIYYDNEQISDFDLSPGLSENPLIGFKVKATKSAPLKVVLTCSEGNKFEETAEIKVS
ncbi:MAG: thiosulfate oxidation carrier complex protein SoxZ [Nitrospirae bacterium]|nr:thiosulfate oxidation carrier complex protein SoxZ [Nitrospirota bacterium]